ncbi:hypothetical protein AGMMS50256_26920 [Betaproteobacteria bacterium]|nr:hypothetical protein AGMMS50256_26920 [Betaproteobacteria bacterium]
MSLLMETLKKADKARRQADGNNASAAVFAGNSTTAPATALTVEALEEAPLAEPIGSPLPDLSRHPDVLDAELTVASNRPPMKGPSLAKSGTTEHFIGHNAASKAFAAQRQPETGSALWLIVGMGILSILGVGAYFWWQLQTLQPPGAGRPIAIPATPPTHPTPSATVMPVSVPPTSDPTVSTSVVSPPLAEENTTVRLAPQAAPAPSTGKSVMSARAPVAPLPPERVSGNSAPVASEPRQEQTDTVFRETRASLQTNTALEHAYEALQSGRDEEAQRDYEQVLRADGKNTDALLGLATLAARQGQVDKAHDYYLRALEADPGDSTARAGVLNTGVPHENAESLLKTALVRQPDSPSLLFALGNLYARQQRWSEAQQTYFQAYAGESDNPDIIFNLAVSLDHLRQNKLAAQYYRMALKAGDTRTVAFNRNQVEVRLLELQP